MSLTDKEMRREFDAMFLDSDPSDLEVIGIKPHGLEIADKKDPINPDHYKVGGIETIDYMKAKSTKEEFCGHLRLTAIKYLSRAGHKDDALQEYKKALWYIEKLVEELSNRS